MKNCVNICICESIKYITSAQYIKYAVLQRHTNKHTFTDTHTHTHTHVAVPAPTANERLYTRAVTKVCWHVILCVNSNKPWLPPRHSRPGSLMALYGAGENEFVAATFPPDGKCFYLVITFSNLSSSIDSYIVFIVISFPLITLIMENLTVEVPHFGKFVFQFTL